LEKLVKSNNKWLIEPSRMDDPSKIWPNTTVGNEDGQVAGPGKAGKPGKGTGGKVQAPVKGGKVIWRSLDPKNNWVDAPNWWVTAHELCGHAMHMNDGTHWRPFPGHTGEKGDRPDHDQAIDEENSVAAEHGETKRGKWDDPGHGESGARKGLGNEEIWF
jgi:hypothetical protein